MRIDSAGRRRFQFRSRAGAEQHGGTYDSWLDAHDARGLVTATPRLGEEAAAGEPTAAELRAWTIERYGFEAWWKTVVRDCDQLTQVDYARGFNDLLPHVRGVTLAQLESSPLLIDQIKEGIASAKTYVPPKEAKKHELAVLEAERQNAKKPEPPSRSCTRPPPTGR